MLVVNIIGKIELYDKMNFVITNICDLVNQQTTQIKYSFPLEIILYLCYNVS